MAINCFEQAGQRHWEVYVSGIGSGGRRYQKRKTKIDSLKKAQEFEFEFKRELARLKEEKIPYRWEEWLDVCLRRMQGSFQNSTVENYRSMLNKWATPFWRGKDIHTITREDVYKVVFENADQKLKPSSRKTVLKLAKRIFHIAIEDGLIQRNPCLGIRIKLAEIEQKVLTTDEANILLQQARRHNHPFSDIWTVALMTGMRSGELYALKWTDIDFETRNIAVQRQWTAADGYGPTKTRKSRVVPISNGLLQFLKELKLRRGDQEFVLPHFHDWSHGEAAKVLRGFCEAIGITPVKFHDLRATFITNLLAQGESLARVMSIVGHGELKTTNGYLRRAGVDVKGGTDKLAYSVPSGVLGQLIQLNKA